MMTRFRLIGCAMVFRVMRFYDAAGFIPSVYGVSENGRFSTCARIVDVEEVL
jgi:hypothetical protein